ncbi:hypothetical protein D3C76_999160 [compost metagenome]
MALGNLADYFQEDRSHVAWERSINAASVTEHADFLGFLVRALFNGGFRWFLFRRFL